MNTYTTTYTTTNYRNVGNYGRGYNSGATAGTGIFILFYLLIAVLMLVSMWKIFVKAGKAGWASLIPFYNIIVMLEIGKLPLWYIFLMFIPVANFIIGIVVMAKMAKAFGKGIVFVLGMFFLPFIFYPILAFGESEYIYSKKIDDLEQSVADFKNSVYNNPQFDPPAKDNKSVIDNIVPPKFS